jgi:hypothetical protein
MFFFPLVISHKPAELAIQPAVSFIVAFEIEWRLLFEIPLPCPISITVSTSVSADSRPDKDLSAFFLRRECVRCRCCHQQRSDTG